MGSVNLAEMAFTLSECSKLIRNNNKGPIASEVSPWPCGVVEQCSRHREKGAHCLSAASLRAAGVGEPRRKPEGPRHGQHGFDHFCRNKSGSSFGGETPISGKVGC